MTVWHDEERHDLAEAVRLLESRGFVSRLTAVAGRSVDGLLLALPARVSGSVATASRLALDGALKLAIGTLAGEPGGRPAVLLHKLAASASGAVGGAFGLSALVLELPVSTTVMLRAIADIARGQGEDLADPEAALACIQVFALGAGMPAEEGVSSGYYGARIAMAQAMAEAARFVAERGLVQEGAPAVVRFVALVASRFGVVVSQKLAAQAVPVIGAVGGAAVNLTFTAHFQDKARGHFIVRRLERRYGADAVHAAYEQERLRLMATAA